MKHKIGIRGFYIAEALKIGGILAVFFCLGFLNACSVKVIDVENEENIYSREHTNIICSSMNFGGGSTDGIYVVLNDVYNSKELAEKYGDSFEVSTIGGSSDNQTLMFLWLYKGTAKYSVPIHNDNWIVELSKGYFGKWKVTNCYPEE